MRIKLNWSVNSLAISESSSRQEFRGTLGLSNIKSICRMSNFKTQEVAEMSKFFFFFRNIECIILYFSSNRIYINAFIYEVECAVQVSVLYK